MLNRQRVEEYVSREIVYFHEKRYARLMDVELREVLRKKNPYLFKAKDVGTAAQLVTDILEAFLSSSEEKLFGDFLEGLAIFVAYQTSGGKKSTAQGIDLEFDRDGVRYLVSVKSGPNWGNSSQHGKLRDDFLRAKKVQSQAHTKLHYQPVLGICYGRTATADNGLYLKIVGQSFWHFLSGDPQLYIDLIEPIGHEAHRHNAEFLTRKTNLINVFTAEFIRDFCQSDGAIDWPSLVEFNSGNM